MVYASMHKDLNIVYVQLVVHHWIRPWSLHRSCQKDRSSISASGRNIQSRRWWTHHKSAASHLWLHLSF